MQTNTLADGGTFMKLSPLDVCKPTVLHHSFLP